MQYQKKKKVSLVVPTSTGSAQDGSDPTPAARGPQEKFRWVRGAEAMEITTDE